MDFFGLQSFQLKHLMMGFYLDPEKPDEVVESYSFTFSYTNKSVSKLTISQEGQGQVRYVFEMPQLCCY